MSQNEPVPPPPDPGAGIDFLHMHRRMIRDLDQQLGQLGDAQYLRVEGWGPIPWNHNDQDWPMPPDYTGQAPNWKQQATTDQWEGMVRQRFENDGWLRTVSLDQLGTEIERGIHNWLHMHWSSRPWYDRNIVPRQDPDDVHNDYLGSTYSSHVNKAFWKLHGWIDDQIGHWERANNQVADVSTGWDGPGGHHHLWVAPAPESGTLLTDEQRELAETFFARIVPDES